MKAIVYTEYGPPDRFSFILCGARPNIRAFLGQSLILEGAIS